jgi:hypothetical protein
VSTAGGFRLSARNAGFDPDYAAAVRGGESSIKSISQGVQEMQQPTAGGEARIVRNNGWIAFAAVMTGAAGALNIVDGFVALYRTSIFKDTMLIGNLRYWAFAFIVFGVVQVAAGFAIYAGQGWARWFALVTVALNTLVQLLAINNYPFYAIAIIAYNVAVLYALGAHWQRRVTPTT